jgi:ABC-2 type transport system permease protein
LIFGLDEGVHYKILGKGLAGILQYAIWVTFLVIFMKLIGPLLNIDTLPILTGSNIFYLILFFILAFFLYSSTYAVFGAGAQDEQHLGQLAWPVLIFLIIPIVMITPITMNPNSSLVVFMSFFPFTAPLVMLIRILVQSPDLWQILLAVAILIISIGAVMIASSRIFRIGILMTGKRFSLKEILRWIKE